MWLFSISMNFQYKWNFFCVLWYAYFLKHSYIFCIMPSTQIASSTLRWKLADLAAPTTKTLSVANQAVANTTCGDRQIGNLCFATIDYEYIWKKLFFLKTPRKSKGFTSQRSLNLGKLAPNKSACLPSLGRFLSTWKQKSSTFDDFSFGGREEGMDNPCKR